jgi:diketogulonate reductase-like aldo/keto reductase
MHCCLIHHRAGKSKAIGVSNFLATHLAALKETSTVTPALNQCKLSVVHRDDATIGYCRSNGIVYQSYSPLCGGFNGSSCSRAGGINVMTQPQVLEIAAAHDVSAAQVGLKWIVQQGFPLATAVWKLEYMHQDLDLCARPRPRPHPLCGRRCCRLVPLRSP